MKDFDFCYVASIFLVYIAWVVLLKSKKGIAITNAFQKLLDEANRKTKTL